MENISHALIGLAVGELTHRIFPPEKDEGDQRLRRRVFLTSSALAGNFPDLDIILTPLLSEPLGYLLHHRGHTHTFLYSLPQAAVLGAILALFWPNARRLLKRSAFALRGFLLLLVLGFGLHMGLDSLNSYGIHPFYPFDPDWYFGDSVFIVEPVFWFIFGAPLAMGMVKKWKRGFAWTLLILSVGGFAYGNFLPWYSVGILIAAGVFLSFLKPRHSLIGAFVLCAFYIGSLSVLSMAARDRLRHEFKDPIYSGFAFNDASLSAFPANPVCWMFVAIESNEKEGVYRIQKGALSLAPSLVSVNDCPGAFLGGAKIANSTVVKDLTIASSKLYSLPYLRQKYSSDCFFQAWMRFARVPALNGANAWDARFQRGGNIEENFSYLNMDSNPESCPEGVPPWGVPRKDLIE